MSTNQPPLGAPDAPFESSTETTGGRERRALLLAGSAELRARMSVALPDHKLQATRSVSEAEKHVRKAEFDVVLIDALVAGSLALVDSVTRIDPGLPVIVLSEENGVAREALESGAADMVDPASGDVVPRIARAIERKKPVRDMIDRLKRAETVCRQLNSARHDLTQQVHSLCNDLIVAYRDLTDQVEHMAHASEFGGLIRQELELENLLRSVLEFLMAKCGPANAAIFLPSTGDEFSLGAYVNYDCPKHATEVLLDQLANVLAPKFEHHERVQFVDNDEDLEELLGPDAHWLSGSDMIVMPCRHDDECLAVVTLFRGRTSPFADHVATLMESISDVLATQLARVIHVHHRHLPKDQWGLFGEPDGNDDIDLAA